MEHPDLCNRNLNGDELSGLKVGAIPSGNSVATMNLLRLAAMTANKEYATRAESILTAHSTQVKQYPAGHTQLMSARILPAGCRQPAWSKC